MSKKNIFAIIVSTIAIIALLIGFKYWNEYRTSRSQAAANAISSLTISFDTDESGEPLRVFEYGLDKIKTLDLVTEHGGELFVDVDEIDLSHVGITEVTYLMTTRDVYGREYSNSETVKYEVKDSHKPEIEIKEEKLDFDWGSEIKPEENVASVKDPVDGVLEKADELKPNTYIIESDVDNKKAGEYKVKVRAMDRNENTSEKEFVITVGEEPVPDPIDNGTEENAFNGKPYQIRVNTKTNILTIYTVGGDGKYSSPFLVMACATSKSSAGKYYTGDKWRWAKTYGNYYAQYLTQFGGGIHFQSAPYNSENPADLRYEDFNKIGSNATTHGSVWLTTEDAKWIYDNVGSGTEVVFYGNSAEKSPLGNPATIHIDPRNDNRGWDPTDPDSANPW